MTRITKEIGFKVKNGKRTETFYQKFKQETLEEFAKQEAVKQFSEDTFGNLIVRKSIEKGAKWQQEQDKNKYSEDDISTAIAMYLENKSFSEIIKQLKNK
jgi:hypothetical protein